jgi:DNA-binding CsgD family transcriptional regulator/pimeloyl-ACP methyl ester carboxylesterase
VIEQPQVQYATSPDAVNIAYWSVGDGPPLVHMSPMPWSNVRLEWQFPPQRAFYEDLAAGLQLVRYDCRGAGLSDRDVSDFSLDAHIGDVLAVADRLRLERFALLGYGHSGGAAIAVAARYPERVSHLILWCSYPRAADYGREQRVRTLQAVMDRDWEFWTRAEALRLSEYEGGETTDWFLRYLRESLTEEGAKGAMKELRKIDVTALMPKVQAPTLVMHRTGIAAITVEMAREIATTIPNARLMLVPGTWIAPYFGEGSDQIAPAIRSFVLETPGPSPSGRTPHTTHTALTPRETDVLRLLAGGRTSREIADELSLSIRTVGRHITNIYAKIGARTRSDATAYAIRHRVA